MNSPTQVNYNPSETLICLLWKWPSTIVSFVATKQFNTGRFDTHLNKCCSCLSQSLSASQQCHQRAPTVMQQPQGCSPDGFGSAQPWEMQTHKEWHLERQASVSLMQISESHCGWYGEQAWTQNGQQTRRKAEWHRRHQATVLFARQLITALNNARTVNPCC